MTGPRIGFAGMTHLGINSAAATAERGFMAICYDTDEIVIARLAVSDPPVTEPKLEDYLARNRDRMVFTGSTADLSDCEVVYIAADVPTDDAGKSDLADIESLIDRVGAQLGPGAVMVVLCQVPPGFTRALSIPKERLYYQVETLIFGGAIERAMYPERFIVGCANPADALPPAYAALLEAFDCPILTMRYESAELAKISINCCLVSAISVANTLAELCERIGADWSEIAPALKLDRRIGEYAYLSPGLGIAGGNLERDLATVQRLAAANETHHDVVDAWLANSRNRRMWAYRMLEEHILNKQDNPQIAVLGLAYKQDTDSIKNSPSLALIERLHGRRVRVYDPVVPATAAPGTEAADDVSAAIDGADVLVVMTPWAVFRALSADDLSNAMAGRCVIDPYRVLDGRALASAGFKYLTLGVAAPGAASGK